MYKKKARKLSVAPISARFENRVRHEHHEQNNYELPRATDIKRAIPSQSNYEKIDFDHMSSYRFL